MFNGVSNAHLYTAARIETSVALGDQTPISKTGTAFFVQNTKGVLCLITNRHLLDFGYGDSTGKFRGATLTNVRVETFSPQGRDRRERPDVRIAFDFLLELSQIKFAAEYHEDVAAIIDPKYLLLPGENKSIDYYLLASELADDSWIESKLSVCDFVAYPGFPTWHDKSEMRPILRTGTIASDPRSNFSDISTSKGRRIAYEAFSSGGSSGSPVYATEKGFKGGGGIEVTGHRESRLIGINAGHLSGDFGAHSGVSYFIKSSAILDLIESES